VVFVAVVLIELSAEDSKSADRALVAANAEDLIL
jgi:hypothetical protein